MTKQARAQACAGKAAGGRADITTLSLQERTPHISTDL